MTRTGKARACLLTGVLIFAATACFKRGVTPIRTHFNKGVYLYSDGDYEAAITEYRLAVEEDVGDHQALFNLAEALESRATRLERAGDPERAEDLRREAEEHYRALLARDPGHLRATVNLAAREHLQGDEAVAEARLRAAIEQHPRSALPRVALAAHRFRGDEPAAIRDAIELLEEVVRRDRKNTDANALLGQAYAALDQLGWCRQSRSDETGPDPELVTRSREAYSRALDHRPGDVGALMGLARLERSDGNPDRAQSLARRALYVRPDLLAAHLMLAELLEAEGALEEATAHLWRARQLEDKRRPRLSFDEYGRRLLDLYRRLDQQERGRAGSPPP